MDAKSKPQSIEAIISFWKSHRRMPSYAEIAKILGFRSKETAWREVKNLIKSGSLQKDSTGRIIPTSLEPKELRLLGVVEAGFGSPADETELDTISLNDWLIEDDVRSFMLKVKGVSMIDAGIHPGDYCIVEKTTHAKVGDIIVAHMDGSWTLKYLRKDERGFYLEAANKKIKAQRPKNDLKIEAVVKAVVRKYG